VRRITHGPLSSSRGVRNSIVGPLQLSFDYVAAMIEGKQFDRPSIDIGNRMVAPIV
jgi:hypothetical protein